MEDLELCLPTSSPPLPQAPPCAKAEQEEAASFLERLIEGGLVYSLLSSGQKTYIMTKDRVTHGLLSPIGSPCVKILEGGILPLIARFGPRRTLQSVLIAIDGKLAKLQSSSKAELKPAVKLYVDRVLSVFGLQLVSKTREEMAQLRESNAMLQSYMEQRGVKISFLENYNIELLREKQQGFETRDGKIAAMELHNLELQHSVEALLNSKSTLSGEIEQLKETLNEMQELANQYETGLDAARQREIDAEEKLQNEVAQREAKLSMQARELEEVKRKHKQEVESLNKELKQATDEIKATEEKAEQLTSTVVELLAQREIKENAYGSPSRVFNQRKPKRKPSAPVEF